MKQKQANRSFFEKINKIHKTPSKTNYKNKMRKQNNQHKK